MKLLVPLLLLFLTGAGSALAENRLGFPLNSFRITSSFGLRKHPISGKMKLHKGVDLAAARGTPVFSVAGGVVAFAGRYAGYGNLVVVLHDNELSTHYAHCESIEVDVADTVMSGTVIGTVGDSGAATGPHLHFEVRRNGVPLDPESIKILAPGD